MATMSYEDSLNFVLSQIHPGICHGDIPEQMESEESLDFLRSHMGHDNSAKEMWAGLVASEINKDVVNAVIAVVRFVVAKTHSGAPTKEIFDNLIEYGVQTDIILDIFNRLGINQSSDQNDETNYWLDGLPKREMILRKITPVVINSYNQPTYLKNIVNSFIENNFSNIFILDNMSDHPELLNYYKEISESRSHANIKILYYNKNYGPQWFHSARLHRIFGDTPHIFTDPDLAFDSFSPVFISTLLDIGERYKLPKIGCALQIPSKQLTKDNLSLFRGQSVAEWESQFWVNQIEPGLYKAAIDTTTHIFIPKFFTEAVYTNNIRVALDGFVAKHWPWFVDDIMSPDEYQFYKRGAKYSSW